MTEPTVGRVPAAAAHIPLAENLSGVPAFLVKTHALVSDKSNAAIVAWAPLGASFIIFDPDRFANELCPIVFRHSKLSSFVRQLNIYGFKKVVSNKAHIEFEHPSFRRDEPQMLYLIRRAASAAAAAEDDAQQRVAAVAKRVAVTHIEVSKLASARETIEDRMEWFHADRQRMAARLDVIAADTAIMRAELAAERAKQAEIHAAFARLAGLIAGAGTGAGAQAVPPPPAAREYALPAGPDSGPDSGRAIDAAHTASRKRKRAADADADLAVMPHAKRRASPAVVEAAPVPASPLAVADALWSIDSAVFEDAFWSAI